MPYIIDGHNLISQLPDIDLADPHDEAKLVLKLRGFAARDRRRIVVIFDEGLPGGESPLSTYSVKVIFATSKRTNADRIIMERIRDERDVRAWVVVSSDREVLAAAKSHGMRAMPCKEFADLLKTPLREKPEHGEEHDPYLSPKEVEEWLKIFGVQDDADPEGDIFITDADADTQHVPDIVNQRLPRLQDDVPFDEPATKTNTEAKTQPITQQQTSPPEPEQPTNRNKQTPSATNQARKRKKRRAELRPKPLDASPADKRNDKNDLKPDPRLRRDDVAEWMRYMGMSEDEIDQLPQDQPEQRPDASPLRDPKGHRQQAEKAQKRQYRAKTEKRRRNEWQFIDDRNPDTGKSRKDYIDDDDIDDWLRYIGEDS